MLKPSEVAPLAAYLLFETIDEAGFPPGVVNLVSGTREDVGARPVAHPEVDAVSFTGSLRVGQTVAETAASAMKRLTLELDGKPANVPLEDAPIEKAVKVGVANAFLNGGQTCTAWTRMVVPADRHDEIVELVRTAAESFVP